MARTGLYKSDVKKARDSLIALGKHPSVDAVRVALGNTGSKTTIHKYLKELAGEEGGADVRPPSLSEALHDLVARLAAQLQVEAHAQIDALRAQQTELEKRHVDALTVAQRDATQWRGQAQQLETALHAERAAHAQTRETLQRETIARHTAVQQVAGLEARLAENEAHRQSLEDKHRHAYAALEHFRQSVKEQREQDQRRHEQQLQQLQAELRVAQQTIVVKQEDVTRLNQEGVRLVAELSHAQQALRAEQERTHRLSSRIDTLGTAEQRCSVLAAQLGDREARAEDLQRRLTAAVAEAELAATQLQATQLELAGAQAAQAAQQGLIAELRATMVARLTGPGGATA